MRETATCQARRHTVDLSDEAILEKLPGLNLCQIKSENLTPEEARRLPPGPAAALPGMMTCPRQALDWGGGL